MSASEPEIDARKTSFGELAETYQKYRKAYDKQIYELLFSLLDPQQKIKILDLGCGTGKSTEPLLEFSDKFDLEIIGYDHDSKMLVEAEKSAKSQKLPITYLQGSAENLKFGDSEFDVVISGTAFHWFVNDKAISEIKRVLKPNGILFVFWKNPALLLGSDGNRIAKDIYSKHVGKSVLSEWRDASKVEKIFKDAGFENYMTQTIITEQHDTLDEVIGGHKTNSKYGVMSPENREKYIAEITEAYKKALGDKPYFVSNRESVVCYGYK